MTNKTILLIEDDPAIRAGLEESLQQEHYTLLCASDGIEGYETACRGKIDLILLDLMLPGMNGQEICRALRQKGNTTPIVMLTAKTEEIDKIVGLEIGADDYITKPFSLQELHARIRAILRRAGAGYVALDGYSFGDVDLDFRKQQGRKNSVPMKLTVMEFRILKYFAEREGVIVTRDMLLDDVWGYESFPTTRTVDNFILMLRKKIEDDPAHPRHILTVHKAGYRFVRDPTES
jgi:DNA-binding response OmpR family regulator